MDGSDVDGLRHRRHAQEDVPDNEEVPVSTLTRPAVRSFNTALAITFGLLVGSCAFGYFLSPISAIDIANIKEVPLTGVFAINDKLAQGTKIPMYAPESMVEDKDGNLYAALRDGRVVKIFPSAEGIIGEGDVENITDGTIPGADDVTDPNILHGIPLGLRLRGDVLYVMDAIYGLFTVNLLSREINILLKPSNTNPAMRFPNDLDITSDDSILYFTDSSTKYPITSLINEMLEGSCSGRLFAYHLHTKKLQTISTGLCFANGVQLTKDERTVIVAETTRYRVSWIDVKTGRVVHALQLPAMPDNVRANRHGSYWVGTTAKWTPTYDNLLSCSCLRQIMAGLFSQEILLHSLMDRHHNMVVEVNGQGEIIRTLHDPEGNLTYALSQATELSDGRVALGSYAAPYLAITAASSRNY